MSEQSEKNNSTQEGPTGKSSPEKNGQIGQKQLVWHLAIMILWYSESSQLGHLWEAPDLGVKLDSVRSPHADGIFPPLNSLHIISSVPLSHLIVSQCTVHYNPAVGVDCFTEYARVFLFNKALVSVLMCASQVLKLYIISPNPYHKILLLTLFHRRRKWGLEKSEFAQGTPKTSGRAQIWI